MLKIAEDKLDSVFQRFGFFSIFAMQLLDRSVKSLTLYMAFVC